MKLGLLCTAAAVSAFSTAVWAADPPPLIPREVLFGNPEKVNVQVSPDGKMLSYLAPLNGVRNVWVRTIGQKDDRAVTKETKRDISAYFWRGDSQHVFHIQDTAGDENFHLYQTNVKSGDSKDMTPYPGVRAQIVSADPKYPDTVMVALNKRDKKFFDAHKLDLKTGEETLLVKNPGDVNAYSVDNNQQIRAVTALIPGGMTSIRIRPDEKSEWKEFQKWGADETFGGVAGFSPDNKALWVVSSVGANAARLVEVDLATGKEKVIAEDPTYDLAGIEINPKTRQIEGFSFVRARTEWQWIDKKMGEKYEQLKKVRAGEVSIGSRDQNDRMWIVTYSSDDGPTYYYLYDNQTGKSEYLFSNRPALEKYKLSKMEPISFPSRDGLTIHGYLSKPLGATKAPMVLLVHGGPWGRDQWGYNSLVQMLTNRGYSVLQVNFRGSTGYGKSFVNAGDREWGGKMHDDLLDAKSWAVKNGHADANKIAIMGGSYGGYATLVGLAFTPDEFACGVDIVGPSNIYTLLSTIPPYWQVGKAMFGKRVGEIGKDDDFLRSRSPLFKAHQIKKPLLIGQGANDPRVKQAESDQIVKAMRDNKLPVEYIVFPDEGHGFARPENSRRFFAASEKFLASCLGGRAEPPAENEKWDKLTK